MTKDQLDYKIMFTKIDIGSVEDAIENWHKTSWHFDSKASYEAKLIWLVDDLKNLLAQYRKLCGE